MVLPRSDEREDLSGIQIYEHVMRRRPQVVSDVHQVRRE